VEEHVEGESTHSCGLVSILVSMEIQAEALAPVPGLNAEAVQDILLDKDSMEHVRRYELLSPW
jgi:hypothetical protein